jgi:PAS domain S-box-containing protein
MGTLPSARVGWLPRSIGPLAAAVGGSVLLAWAFDLETLKAPLQGGASMKANTALCFVLAGAALATTSAWGVPSGVGGALALATAAIAGATLAEYALSWNLHIDQLLAIDDDPTSAPAGRMSPMTAVCFTAFGLAIWVSRTPRRLWLREPLAAVTLLASAVASLGYAYDTRALYSVGPYTSMAPHTAVLMTLLSIGLLAQHPSGGALAGVIFGRDLGGATARRLLPWALATPMVVGWLGLQGQRAGLWWPEFDMAMVVLATMVIVSAVILTNARSLRASERSERAAVDTLRELTRTLERRVEEKTQALAEREHHLRAVIDRAQDAFVAVDETGTIVDWNPRAVAIFGWARDAVIGRAAVTLLAPEGLRLDVQRTLERAFRTAAPPAFNRRIETVAVHRDGHELPVELSMSLVRFGPGWRLNAFVRDLTTAKQSEARFRALLESAPDAMVITDEAGVITLANQQAGRLFGYSNGEFVGMRVDALLPARLREAHAHHRRRYGADPQPRAMGIGLDLWAVDKHGAEFPVEVSLSPLHTQSGVLISTAIRDITWRRELEADRRRFVYLAEQSQDFIAMCDLALAPFYVNDAGRRLVGLDTLDEARRVTFGDFFFPEDRPFIENEFLPRVIRDGHGTVEIRFRHFRTGYAIWMNYRVSNLRDERGQVLGWASISSDITARRRAEAALRASLDDKETLLREVHHRVKNNLAVIGSLLYLQSTYITDPVLQGMLQESQERVRSIALVHERLYRSRDVAEVDFAEYVRELSAELMRNHATDAATACVTFQLDPMVMDLDRAVLAGLILNESISNALKHAFPDRRPGAIRVGLRATPGGFILSVADNGIGLPGDAASQPRKSLGMLLIHALASQLGGRVEFNDAHPGTEMRLVVEDAHVRS